MLLAPLPSLPEAEHLARCGDALLHRATTAPWVSYLASGRVTLGVIMVGGVMAHQFGVVQGPCWLEASAAVLNLPSAVDAVAQTDVYLRHMPLAAFRQTLSTLPEFAQKVMRDMALAHRQQTEWALSRLAQDAQSRCAEWLLRHAKVGEKGDMTVQLQERKRTIAAQLGIAPETLSRVLRHLREGQLISGSGRLFNLLDPSGLRCLAGI